MLNIEPNSVAKKSIVVPLRPNDMVPLRPNAPDFGDACLHSLFERQADATPDADALISPQCTLSYAQLETAANQMARFLRAQGAGPGKFVGIYMDRGSLPVLTILGALKAGATYVPIDPAFPADRIKHIVEETELCMLLTELSLAERTRDFYQGLVLPLDVRTEDIGRFPGRRLEPEESGARPDALAYLIYTSGTTGRPKGVMAEHRHAYRYTLAFNEPCGTGPADRVYQGFSLGFDGSIEEIWMAFSNGSALVVPDKDTPKFGAELGAFLNKMGVTYFSTVPTLLSTIPEAIPSLRTLVLSGEICPAELVNRWAHPPLRMWNVYGPTEGTVNTTAFLCRPGKPVTIGKPLRGYEIHILDESFRPVARGESGELFVGGRTLARGYLRRPDLTAEKFLDLPGLGRVYRTGDLVRWNAEGELEFFGRIDSQVKIRGYRVELAEIETVLLEHPNIRSAAVTLVEKDGLQELAAYVVLQDAGLPLDRNALLARLELRLPPYMVPGFLDELSEFPMLASGKTDRKKLPEPLCALLREKGEFQAPATETEEKVASVWAEVFSLPKVSVEDHFFHDLGGHSLLAARMVTSLRKAGSPTISAAVAIRDVYSQPTVRKLAQYLDSVRALQKAATLAAQPPKKTASQEFAALPRFAYPLTTFFQAAGSYLLYALHFLPFYLALAAEISWVRGGLTTLQFWGAVAAITLFTWPALLLVNLAAKWILIGRYKAGSHRLWGAYYCRWWLANRIQALCRLDVIAGTPLMNAYARLMGAKIGHGCVIETMHIGAWDLLRLGDDSSIGMDSQLLGYRVENGRLLLGAIDIGADCFVGIHSALGLNVRLENRAALDDQSYLPDGHVIPAGEHRRGSPAARGHVSLPQVEEIQPRSRGRALFALAHLALVFLMEATLMMPVLGALAANAWVFQHHGAATGWLASLGLVPVGFVAYALWFALVRRVVLNKAEPGIYAVESVFYLRKWFTDRLMRMSRYYLLPLYTTIFLPHWMRLLGAKIGQRAELSVLMYFSPDLIDLGDESFFADSSIIGGKRFYRRHFQLAMNKVGRRSFVGNAAVLPVGASLGDGCLLGVTSMPPARHTPDGTDWVGSPAFSLPSRQKVGSFSEEEIFRPTPRLIALRCLIDSLRILIPSYALFAGACAMFFAMMQVQGAYGAAALALSAPLLGMLLMLWFVAVTAATKWLFMGRIKPEVKPLWSPYVWSNEMVNGVYESTMSSALIPLHGTPFVAPLLRLIGCRIGKRCYIESTLFSEFDLVQVGDYVALNRNSIVQNHLFEDRVMKSSWIRIEDECSVGNMAVVLYDTEMHRGANIGPLSLLMKGEAMKARSHWHGIPTVQLSAGEDEPNARVLAFTGAKA